MVRLPQKYSGAFEQLTGEFAGLPPATVLRMIAVSFLQQPYDVQVERIEEQIRPAKKSGNRQHKNNSRATVSP